MLWIRLRFLAVAALSIGVACVGANVYVRGSQEPAPTDGQRVSKQPTTTTAQTSTPRISKKATGQPATSTPKAMLRAQQFAIRKAKASYEIAKLTRELAEIAIEEYEEVIYPPELAAVDAEIKLAESDLPRAEDRFVQAKTRFEKNQILPPPLTEELAFQRARFALEQALSDKKVLEEFTKRIKIKMLESEVHKAKSDELAKKATYTLEIAKEKAIEREARLKTT